MHILEHGGYLVFLVILSQPDLSELRYIIYTLEADRFQQS